MSAENQQNDSSTERGQKLLIVLVILALVASIVMLFTGSLGALKLALLAALWAAILGMFLVSRYRAQAVASRAQLESEIELGQARLAEATQRFEADKASLQVEMNKQIKASEEETLKAIRQQLDELREQLEYLTGQSLAEPGMLRAHARRIMEIETATAAVTETAPTVSTVSTDSPKLATQPAPTLPSVEETAVISKVTVPQEDAVGVGTQQAEQKPITAEFAVVTPLKQEDLAHDEQAHAEHRAGEGKLSVSQLAAAAAHNSPYIGGKRRKESFAAPDTQQEEKAAANASTFPKVDETPAEQATVAGNLEGEHSPASRGRRRRDEHSSAVSVADLLKRNQKEPEKP